jgi:hypothetical protein
MKFNFFLIILIVITIAGLISVQKPEEYTWRNDTIYGYLNEDVQYSQVAALRNGSLQAVNLLILPDKSISGGIVKMTIAYAHTPKDKLAEVILNYNQLSSQKMTKFELDEPIFFDISSSQYNNKIIITIEAFDLSKPNSLIIVAGKDNYLQGELYVNNGKKKEYDIAFQLIYKRSLYDYIPLLSNYLENNRFYVGNLWIYILLIMIPVYLLLWNNIKKLH